MQVGIIQILWILVLAKGQSALLRFVCVQKPTRIDQYLPFDTQQALEAPLGILHRTYPQGTERREGNGNTPGKL